MCCKDSETSDHLFMDCIFTQDVWSLTLHGLNVPVPEKISLVLLFSTWKSRYPYPIKGKLAWSGIWVAIPKYVCWNIWLARNDKIFNNNQQNSLKVAAKIKAFLIETVGVQTFKKGNPLLLEENKWLGTYIFRDREKDPGKPSTNPRWRLRDTDAKFQIWWNSQAKA